MHHLNQENLLKQKTKYQDLYKLLTVFTKSKKK